LRKGWHGEDGHLGEGETQMFLKLMWFDFPDLDSNFVEFQFLCFSLKFLDVCCKFMDDFLVVDVC
jgi:hypothetical protein